jgi:hypothetical protein
MPIAESDRVFHVGDPATQMKWVGALLDRDRRDTNIRALVIGMHEALPESLARSHSMSDLPTLQATGLLIYSQLSEVRKTMPVEDY